ncbi:hypothetical protein E4U54_004254 [Claviceps lovelessii]|nr:hypothetical protein E4U54_004254 [Claviceps lovelessii]
MLFKSCLAAGMLASGAVAGAIKGRSGRCAAEPATQQQLDEARQFGILEAELLSTGGPIHNAPVEVNVYFHSVSATPKGLLSDAALHKQFQVLAADYQAVGFHMKLGGITKSVNKRWSDWTKFYEDLDMQKHLRNGTYQDLNLYFVDKVDGMEALGLCRFPMNAPRGSDDYLRDGCFIQSGTVPGGSQPPEFNLGKTATHETGHWLGLLHTFEGGCSNPGDGVADTPAQESSTSGCPAKRDSCPKMPGLDPIHNYMDYSDE